MGDGQPAEPAIRLRALRSARLWATAFLAACTVTLVSAYASFTETGDDCDVYDTGVPFTLWLGLAGVAVFGYGVFVVAAPTRSKPSSAHAKTATPEARLFAGSGADALRTSIGKACRAAGIPVFSPHDLRHRRISLLHLRGVPWARIGEFVGQRSLSVTAEVYSHVLSDEIEADYARLLSV